jgi:hypothetical protein
MSYRVSKNEDTQNFDNSGTQIWNLKKNSILILSDFFFNLDYLCLYNTIIMINEKSSERFTLCTYVDFCFVYYI